MAKYDIEVVRQMASGQWRNVLTSVAGIPADSLDERREHPCPKCGGDTRFRLIDEDAGAVFCNHCFNSKNGDGFAAVQWALDVKFPEALEKIAEYVGAPAEEGGGKKRKGKSKKAKPKVDPAKDLSWRPWAQGQVDFLLLAKPGLTVDALQRAGAKFARYKNQFSVLAFPIIGEGLDVDKPVGWAIIHAMGKMLPVWDREGNVTGYKKVKITFGSDHGFIGIHAIERMKLAGMVECVWKTEGVTDMVALMEAVPAADRDRHVVLSNANGATEGPKWMAGILARMPRVHVLHDCDVPGQKGAAKWMQAIALDAGRVRNVVLPYEIDPKAGKDVRDFLNEPNSYGDVWAIAEKADEHTVKVNEDGSIDLMTASFPVQEKILEALQLDVISNIDGQILVYSRATHKNDTFSTAVLDRLGKARLIAICGPPAMSVVSSDPDGEASWQLKDVREAIGWAASRCHGKQEPRGVGVWQSMDEEGHELDALVLVNGTHIAKYTASEGMKRYNASKIDGLALHLGDDDWFKFDELSRLIEEAKDRTWCNDVIDQLCNILAEWRWSVGYRDPLLVTGLALATWVQTVWNWRPLVAVAGESHTGKSSLFEAFGGSLERLGLFGRLAFLPQEPTEPSIRQGLGGSARATIIDELEHSPHREKIFKMFRVMSRGGIVARGSAGGRGGMAYELRHIPWIAATESGLREQPDINRFVQLELLRAPKNKNLVPPNGVMARLGQKLLAIAIAHCLEAKKLTTQLKLESFENIDARTIEVYSTPVAMLATAKGLAYDEAVKMLQGMLPAEDEAHSTRDHLQLLEDIWASKIHCAHDGWLSVEQIIRSPGFRESHIHKLIANGVGYKCDTADEEWLMISIETVTKHLLKHTTWEKKRTQDLMKRAGQAGDAVKENQGRLYKGQNRKRLWAIKMAPMDRDDDEAPQSF